MTECNKIVFASKAEAKEYARAFRRGKARHSPGRKIQGTWRAYPCRNCGKYHLTTQSKAEAVQRRKRQKRKKKGN